MSLNRYDLHSAKLPPVDRSTARLLYVSSAKYGGSWHSSLHTHSCTEFFYVVSGTGHFRLCDDSVPISGGDLLIINPHIEHKEIHIDADPLEYIIMGVEGLRFSSGASQEERCCLLHTGQDNDEFLFLFRCILTEMDEKAPGYEMLTQDLLEILVIRLLRNPEFTLSPSSESSAVSRRSSKDCAQVRQYIDEHYQENITLDLLAETAHLNKYYLVHSFSREYGVSPINYLIMKRIEASKHLLSSTDQSMSQISSLLGFSSASYFSQSFRRIVGESPIEFRKHQRIVQ